MKKVNEYKTTAAIALLLAGWFVAFGLWFKADYAWAQMRAAKSEVSTAEDKMADWKEEADRASADAHRAYVLWRRCSGQDTWFTFETVRSK